MFPSLAGWPAKLFVSSSINCFPALAILSAFSAPGWIAGSLWRGVRCRSEELLDVLDSESLRADVEVKTLSVSNMRPPIWLHRLVHPEKQKPLYIVVGRQILTNSSVPGFIFKRNFWPQKLTRVSKGLMTLCRDRRVGRIAELIQPAKSSDQLAQLKRSLSFLPVRLDRAAE